MSNISITGNEAQFNENVTFLKDVNIGGFLSLPNQQLSLNRLDVPDIRGVPSLQITGVTTFTDDVSFLGVVNFSQALSFPDLEVRDRLRVGSGGTVITADSRLNPGKVGIGNTQPTELLDVFGKAKIIDLDLENLNVTGFSTFVGITTQKSTLFATKLNVSGLSTFNDDVRITGTGNLILDGSGPQVIKFQDNLSNGIQLRYRNIEDQFTIAKVSDNSKFFLADRDNGQVELYNSNIKRLATTGVGITVFGDIIVPDVDARTSRVGLGTTNPSGITNLLNDDTNGPLRLAIDGSLALTRNLYDSAGSPGASGAFLNRDETGVRWVTFEPSFSEGIFIQDEGTYIPVTGAAKSYSIVNFKSINSFGQGTDTVRPEDAGTDSFNIVVENKTGTLVGSASTILFLDNTTNIAVGQLVVCDTNGVVSLGATVLAVPAGNTAGVVTISQASLLSSDITSTFDFGTTDFFGLANILTFDFWGFEGNDIYRMSNVGIGSSVPSVSLDVIGDTQISGGTTTGNLKVTGFSTFVGLSTFGNNVEIAGTLNVHDATQSTNTTSGSVVIAGGVGIASNVNIGEILTVTGNIDANANLDVDGQTDLDVLNVAELATFDSDIDANGSLDVAGNTILGDASGDSLTVNATSTFNANINANANLDVDGHTELDDLRVSGVSTFVDNIDADGNLDVDGQTDLDVLNVAELATFDSNIDANANLDVDGITDLDLLNVAEKAIFKDDVEFHGVSGITSVSFDKSDNSLKFVDNARLKIGDDGDLQLYHNSLNSWILDQGTGQLVIGTNGEKIRISKGAGAESLAEFRNDSSVDLYYDNTQRFSTSGIGATVYGQLDTTDLNVSGVSTFVGITTQKSTLFANKLSVSGVSTFKDTIDIDSTVKDRNDSVGTTVAENLSNPITDVNYNSTTGIMVITIANHGFANGDSIQIPDGTITLSCNYKGVTINQSYPRSKDPNSGKWLVISNVTTNTFQVDVGDGGLAAGVTHNFVSASGGVLHSSGQYVEYDYRLASVGTGVSWRPSGVQTKRTIWVSKSGSDTNSGLLEGDAKATIGAAASIAVETDTIKIRPGLYIEDNPIGLRTDVSVTGEDLRLVTVQSKNKNKDVFHVRRGCLIENLNFGGSNVGVSHAGAACVAFPTPAGPDSAITGYTEPGPATEGLSGRWRSPYVRNCTNFMTDSIGLKVDGDNATASTIGADLKSMVVDSYTQYNENGIGVSLTNNGYAQLVSIFTISCDIGIFASSGAQCDLTNSNSSFGNFGLVAVGLGSTQFTGVVSSTNPAGELIASTNPEGQDTVVCANVRDFGGIERRPFDGQSLFFKIDLNNYTGDVNTAGITTGIDHNGRITEPLQQLRSVNLIATESDLQGFSAIDPPSVLIRDFDGEVEPKGPQGIIAEAVADVDATGKLVGVDVIAQGRNYLSGQNIVVDIEGNTGLATAVMEPIFFTVASSTENPVGSIGIATVTFNEFIPYELFPDDPFSLQRISRILTSSHSFEYVGAGTDINISTPLQGAIPIKANEIVAKDGAQIPFTSTDQQGNFDIGEGLQINQTTSSITGRDFSRSIQAQVTPLILALR